MVIYLITIIAETLIYVLYLFLYYDPFSNKMRHLEDK